VALARDSWRVGDALEGDKLQYCDEYAGGRNNNGCSPFVQRGEMDAPPIRRPYWPEITVPDDINSKSIREKLGWTQSRLARMVGVSVRTIEGWKRIKDACEADTTQWGGYIWKERQRRPTGAARVLWQWSHVIFWIVFDF
jgi:hypothetical protein